MKFMTTTAHWEEEVRVACPAVSNLSDINPEWEMNLYAVLSLWKLQ